MKKNAFPLVAAICLIAGIAYTDAMRNQATRDTTDKPDPVTISPETEPVNFKVPTGDSISFEVRYRGITGQNDDVPGYGSSAWQGQVEDSPFIKAVRQKVQNELFIALNPCLTDRNLAALEYKGRRILHFYFDLNGDGALSDNERLRPAQVSKQFTYNDESVVFLTPDFMVTNKAGQTVPFRVIICTNLFPGWKTPNVYWKPMGLYEGVTRINGEKMRFYLFPCFVEELNYRSFGNSKYAIVPESRKRSEKITRYSLSSLIVHNDSFYRLHVAAVKDNPKRLTITMAEDKSPRGKFTVQIQGKESFQSQLSRMTLKGVKDKTLRFRIDNGLNELPTGHYQVSSGVFTYGQRKPEGYKTSFDNGPAFAINAARTTTIQLGRPKMTIRAIEYDKRYHRDKQYKTEFTKGTKLYIDGSFTGMAQETYGSLKQAMKKDNGIRYNTIKAPMC